MVRVFCAVELPEAVKEKIKAYIARLRREFPDVRASWSGDNKLHITLKFFGDTPLERVALISAAADRAASAAATLHLRIQSTGAFPSGGRPRVLWLGINDENRALEVLQQRFEDECENDGFVREPRPFKPHLTLARLRDTNNVATLAAFHRSQDFQTEDFAVESFYVIRSELGPTGSKYSKLSAHQFKMQNAK